VNGFPPLPQGHPPTYPPALPVAQPFPGPPPVRPTFGPAVLGTGAVQGSPTTGVPGVVMSPVATVPPAPVPGGPHPLPSLPPCPVPQGFPNPFAVVAVPPWAPAAAPPPLAPGTTTVTGPRGYLPGIGDFG